ncbi:MAG: protein translocase subunit SecD [Hyphomicrobiaceae bacterium]
MLHFARWKSLSIVAVCLAGLILSLPNLFSKETVKAWPDWLPKAQMPLGLDLQGGAHLLLAANSDELKKDWLSSLREDARKVLREAKLYPASVNVVGGTVRVTLLKPQDSDAAVKELRTKVAQQIGNALIGTAGTDIAVAKGEGASIILTPTEAGFLNRQTNAITASIETINRRVNALGTSESTVVRQGSDRILVQFPGLSDTKGLKDLIGKTAKLSFHEVHASMTPAEAQQGRPPVGFAVYPSQDGYVDSYLLRDIPIVQGDELVDAQPGQDSRTGEWIISFRFNQAGARKFGRFTQANVGRPFAIVLDKQVLSAPVIREAILGGSGQISGRFSPDSATTLALQLRSGALPTELTIVEERTVGPSLGADSVSAGKTAAVVGAIATCVLMVFAYGTFGVIAVFALFFNMLLITATMSVVGMTLTLPGIAGLVLTLGMAVDANVLIYERIREEVRSGRSPINAIEAGFSRAFVTILDSQLTTLAAAIIMFILGAGPIRGFAVTLSVGIFTSIFTAVTVTRLLVAWWLAGQRARAHKIVVPV